MNLQLFVLGLCLMSSITMGAMEQDKASVQRYGQKTVFELNGESGSRFSKLKKTKKLKKEIKKAGLTTRQLKRKME